jgi:hypothetical protein
VKPASHPTKKEKKEGHKKRKVDKEGVKPLPKVLKGKAVTAAESTKLTSKKRNALVLLDDEDDEDDEDNRPYRKHLIGQNIVRPPIPDKLARSPKKKEDVHPAFSDNNK